MITIVVPIYDDHDSLQTLLTWIEHAPIAPYTFLILDNGSTDERIWPLLQAHAHRVRTLRVPVNLGFGGGILHALEQTETEWVGWMPGNLKIHPNDVATLVHRLSEWRSYDLVKCTRVGRSWIPRLKTLVAGALQSVIGGTWLFDTGGTPTFCRRGFVLGLPRPPRDVTFESYVLYAARWMHVPTHRPPMTYGTRLFGISHWQRGWRAELRLLLRLMREIPRWRRDLGARPPRSR